jgi:hypothetical protein
MRARPVPSRAARALRRAFVRCAPAIGLALAASCGDDTPAPYTGPPVGILDDSPLFPFPSMHLMAEDAASATGYRVAIPEGLLPVADEGAPQDVRRFNRRDGFSIAQPIVFLLPDQDIDPASLPDETRIPDSLDPDCPVRILDVETGERVPLLAEPDIDPDVTGPADRTWIIRPMKALAFGGHYAVVLTTAVRLRDGSSLRSPPRFAALKEGRADHPGLRAWIPHYRELLDALEGHGVPRDQIALAWDFFTASDESTHRTFDHVLAATRADLPGRLDYEPTYRITEVEDETTNPSIHERVLRRVRGTYEIASFVNDEQRFTFGDDGLPIPQGRDDSVFVAVIPVSARDAAAGSFGVLVYGHGLLDSPEWPLGGGSRGDRDGDSVARLCDELHLIAIGTEWRGLSERDEVDAAGVAVDFSRFPVITDRLQQGVANALALERLVRTRFREAEPFQAAGGGGSLIDPDRILYYGISLGGIEGTTLVANAEFIRFGVFHVPGAVWTSMLERSANWEDYDRVMRQWTPDPVDRQVLYAVSQMFWDPVDPITHHLRIRAKSGLWQEAMGDAQVPNLSTDLMARSVGVPLLQPSVDHPPALDESAAPLPPGSSAVVQFDPGCGRTVPGNRPNEENHAHGAVRNREETLAQIRAFFAPGAEGTIIHPCEGPCVWTDCR